VSTLENSLASSAGNSAAGCDDNISDNGNVPDGGIGTHIVDSGPQNPDAYIVRPDADGPPLWVEDGDTLYTDPHTTDGGDGDSGGNPIIEDSNEYMQTVRTADGTALRCPTESALWRSGTGIFRLGDIGDRQLCYYLATDSREMTLLPERADEAHMPETGACYPGFINVTRATSRFSCAEDEAYNTFRFCPWIDEYQIDLYPARINFTCVNEDNPAGLSFSADLAETVNDIYTMSEEARQSIMIGTICDDGHPPVAIPINPDCNSTGYLDLEADQSLLFDCRQGNDGHAYSAVLRTWGDYCPEGISYEE